MLALSLMAFLPSPSTGEHGTLACSAVGRTAADPATLNTLCRAVALLGRLRRNITVTSVPGLDPPPMLDFQFKLSVLELCDTCWFTMHDIAVKDERMVSRPVVRQHLGVVCPSNSSCCCWPACQPAHRSGHNRAAPCTLACGVRALHRQLRCVAVGTHADATCC
jgi:hypothetical protein